MISRARNEGSSSLTRLLVLGHHLNFKTVLEVSQFRLNLFLGERQLLDLAALVLELDVSGTLLSELYNRSSTELRRKVRPYTHEGFTAFFQATITLAFFNERVLELLPHRLHVLKLSSLSGAASFRFIF